MFYSFVLRYQLKIETEAELDAALCEFVDHLYLEGEDSSFGQKLQAALEFERPEFAREGRLSVPRFKRALKGWRRLSPTQTRLPMLESLKSMISGIFLKFGHHEEALYNEATFSTYARPGEMLAKSHGSRCGGQKPGVSSRCHSVGAPRTGRKLKGGHLRRDIGVGRCKSHLAGSTPGCTGQGQVEEGGGRCKPMEFQPGLTCRGGEGQWSSFMQKRLQSVPTKTDMGEPAETT